MSSEHTFDDKGKVRPKTPKETAVPQKNINANPTLPLQGQLDLTAVTQMQKTMGNTAVQRFLAQRSGSGPTELDEETAGSIQSQRGGGNNLDKGIAAKAGNVMGQDFSDVQVHTDSQADQLNRQLGSKAFTTGGDIFFREGAYDPVGSDGQHLISHELTHVVQQGGAVPTVQGKMTVNDPNDQYEAEADQVADIVMTQPEEKAVQRQTETEEEELQMQEMEEEEEALQMQEMEEEEEMEDSV